MKKLLTVIGTRPQIIKAAALTRVISELYSDKLQEIIVHTGQHYDKNMSDVFFDELGMPDPNYNLAVGAGYHGEQTAKMIEKLEQVFFTEKPDAVVLYGDTNSTLAGAIAASKIQIPIIHIEAGLRSFNKTMPEEINRIMCDHVSTLLFAPTVTSFNNLITEGLNSSSQAPYSADNPLVLHCGDVMYDNSLFFAALGNRKSTIIEEQGLENKDFVLATIHRHYNTDDKERMGELFIAIQRISVDNNIPIVLPLHPRTTSLLKEKLSPALFKDLDRNELVSIIPPVSYLDMIALEKNAKIIITDSGGVQKEACFFNKPCVILRSETEWVELVESGAAIVADANESKIIQAYNKLVSQEQIFYPQIFGNGKAAQFICEKICEHI